MKNPQFSIRWDEKANVWVIYSHRFDKFTQVINPDEALRAAISMDNMIEKVMKERDQ